MRIIDVHAHYIPLEALPSDALRRSGRDVHFTLGERIGPLDAAIVDLSAQYDLLERSGVTSRVLSLPPFALGDNFPGDEGDSLCRRINRELGRLCAESQGRFLGLATVPLSDPRRATDVLREAVSDHGLAGVEICSYAGAFELDDGALEPFWTAVESVRVPVLIHPHRVAGAARMAPYYLRNIVGNPTETALAASRLIFGNVLARHPELTIVLSHGGGALPSIIGRLEHGADVRPECRSFLRPREALNRFYFDTVVFDPAILRALLTLVPIDHVVLGSDSPFSMSDVDPVATVEAAVASQDEREAILSSTATALLLLRRGG